MMKDEYAKLTLLSFCCQSDGMDMDRHSEMMKRPRNCGALITFEFSLMGCEKSLVKEADPDKWERTEIGVMRTPTRFN